MGAPNWFWVLAGILIILGILILLGFNPHL
jgi:hypothetical protein